MRPTHVIRRCDAMRWTMDALHGKTRRWALGDANPGCQAQGSTHPLAVVRDYVVYSGSKQRLAGLI